MASFYADENFPRRVVEALRRLGHDVVTAAEAGQANQGIADEAVLEHSANLGRAVLTINRWHYIRLHAQTHRHGGVVVCSYDRNAERQAAAIDAAVRALPSLEGVLLRINRPA